MRTARFPSTRARPGRAASATHGSYVPLAFATTTASLRPSGEAAGAYSYARRSLVNIDAFPEASTIASLRSAPTRPPGAYMSVPLSEISKDPCAHELAVRTLPGSAITPPVTCIFLRSSGAAISAWPRVKTIWQSAHLRLTKKLAGLAPWKGARRDRRPAQATRQAR